MEITVRDATPADAPAIAMINLASWEAAYRGVVADRFLDAATLANRTERWNERLGAGAHPVLVADTEGALAGYCSLSLPSRDADGDARTGEVAAIYVAPERFRSGVGSAMLEAALALMRDRGFRDATLWVLTENTRARAFYARRGFSPDGVVQWLAGLGAGEMRLSRPL